MKNINWRRIALYIVVVLIVPQIFILIYESGIFHPKEVLVNDMKFTAPKGSYLVYASSSDNKYHFSALSPLTLNFESKYFIDDNQSIGFTFSNMDKEGGSGIKDIRVAKASKTTFNKMLSWWEKEENYDVLLFKGRYGQCSDIYRISEKTEENMFLDLFLFNEEKKMMVSLLITHKEDVKESLYEICSKKAGV